MARKGVENNAATGSIELDNEAIVNSAEQQPKKQILIPKADIQESLDSKPVINTIGNSNEPVSCLRNEKIIVKFIPRPSSLVQNKNHVLWGGMAENAVRCYVVPRLQSTNNFVNVLTNREKEFLERAMGLEYNDLSIYKRNNNFWDDSNPNGIGRVVLHKQNNILDLSSPTDYIKYKILLANKDYICPSLRELEERPKATYQFVIISENAEAKSNLSRVDTTKRCWMQYGKIENDVYTLITLLELIEGRPISSKVKLDYLQGKVTDYIQKDPRKFLSLVTDELLPTKVLIRRCQDAGLIGKRNDAYYLKEDNTPLCEIGENSTLNNAAKYISSVKRQQLKFSLEAKLKE